MTSFLLIRHAANDTIGKRMAGRMPGVHLNAEGLAQAERLAQRLSKTSASAIYSSPLERARETAAPVADRLGIPVHVCAEIAEIDYGEWTGLELRELAELDRWRQYNFFRSGTRIPQGELMLEAQLRTIVTMERLRRVHPGETIALVTHGDIIKAALAHYAGIPLDLFQRIEINCASVSVIVVEDWDARILRVNDTGEWEG